MIAFLDLRALLNDSLVTDSYFSILINRYQYQFLDLDHVNTQVSSTPSVSPQRRQVVNTGNSK